MTWPCCCRARLRQPGRSLTKTIEIASIRQPRRPSALAQQLKPLQDLGTLSKLELLGSPNSGPFPEFSSFITCLFRAKGQSAIRCVCWERLPDTSELALTSDEVSKNNELRRSGSKTSGTRLPSLKSLLTLKSRSSSCSPIRGFADDRY